MTTCRKHATRALAVAVAMTTVAHAQGPDAEVLLREAGKLMEQQAFAAACEKLEASERLAASIGTELDLADCREKTGQLASAWAMFVKASQTAKHSGDREREAEAQQRAAALEPRLVYLTISVPQPARVAGLVVHRNDTVVEAALYGQPVPVDPGEYRITAEAPDHERWQSTISVDSTSQTIEVPPFAVALTPPPPAVEPAPVRDPDPPSSWTTRRKAAVVLGVLGVAAGGTGIAFGLKGGHLESQSDAICPTVQCDDPAALDLNRRARTDGLIGNVGMIGGGAMVVGAIALWIVGDTKSHDGVSIMPSIGPSGIALVGAY